MPQAYAIEYYRSVKKDLRKIDHQNRVLIVEKIQSLANNPRPSGVSKLQDAGNLYRIRVGDYRIVYEIIDKRLVITIVKVGHRSRIYN